MYELYCPTCDWTVPRYEALPDSDGYHCPGCRGRVWDPTDEVSEMDAAYEAGDFGYLEDER